MEPTQPISNFSHSTAAKIITVIFLIAGGYLGLTQESQPVPELPASGSPSTPGLPADAVDVDMSDWKTYRNEEYGFEFKYPPTLVASDFSLPNDNLVFAVVDPVTVLAESDKPYDGISVSIIDGVQDISAYVSQIIKDQMDYTFEVGYDGHPGVVANLLIRRSTFKIKDIWAQRIDFSVRHELFLPLPDDRLLKITGIVWTDNFSSTVDSVFRTFRFLE